MTYQAIFYYLYECFFSIVSITHEMGSKDLNVQSKKLRLTYIISSKLNGNRVDPDLNSYTETPVSCSTL